MRRCFVLVSVLVSASASVWACTEATDGLIPNLDASTSSPAAPSGVDDSGSGEEAPKDAGRVDAQTSSTGAILINEVSSGGEWIELANSGDQSVDISAWKVADSDKGTGAPKLSEAVVFPPRTALGPKEYGIVQAGGVDGGKACPAGEAAFCFHAEFGISKKNGENLYLLDDGDEVVGTVVYPADAAANTAEAWARIPDRDPKGIFVHAPPSPGAANAK